MANREAENRPECESQRKAEKEEKRWRRSRGRNNACELERGGEAREREGVGERD